jgi:hypothetical protein
MKRKKGFNGTSMSKKQEQNSKHSIPLGSRDYAIALDRLLTRPVSPNFCAPIVQKICYSVTMFPVFADAAKNRPKPPHKTGILKMKQNLLTTFAVSVIVSLFVFAEEPQAAEWYKGQLHCHSYWSDGHTLPELAIGWYKDNGYHFVALTDHSILQLDPNKWYEAAGERIAESKGKFGQDWVETKEENGKTLVRLKTFAELASKLNEAGKFVLIPGHEQNTNVAGVSLHANAINITESIPFPGNFPSVAEGALAWRKASLENSAKNSLEGFWMLNHPEYPYYEESPEDLIAASEVEFYERYNPSEPRKHQPQMPSPEKYWDIINAFRILAGAKPIYGVASDDAHHYPNSLSTAALLVGNGLIGHGWLAVRSETLNANSLIRAMKKGDFYSSTGVVLKDVRFDPATKTLTVEVDPVKNVRYSIKFVGTKKGFDSKKEPFVIPQEGERLPMRKGFTYSDQIGATFKTVEGTTASYQMASDDMYVRAIVTADKTRNKIGWVKAAVDTAWTQPVGW